MNDFLFELGCEELPFGEVLPLSNALASTILDALEKAQIPYTSIQNYATPRRLAVLITNLPDETPGSRSLRRGPTVTKAYDADAQPTRALEGFAKSCGVKINDLIIDKTDKGTWIAYESISHGIKTSKILPSIIKQAINTLPIVKPMRWGQGDIVFVRPIHWVVMLLGTEILHTEILGVSTNRNTYGHRFHAPIPIRIDNPSDYETLLHSAYVIADFSKRRTLIKQQIEQVAQNHAAYALMPEMLLDEVTAIVEWPKALVANFEKDFLDIPAEALIAAMQTHQKCFALQDKQGKLLPKFVTVSNICSHNPWQIIEGNEKVMRARLSDAAFFFRQDKKQPLSHHIASTGKVIFQLQLGTMLDKTTRMQTLMSSLITSLGLNQQEALRAVQLSKCDLMTGMVGEFPELQGVMGYYYALHDDEAPQVAQALREQYLPRFAKDELPTTPLGMALSLIDRLDTLVGIFTIDQKPTGEKDPFKLRRHALAIGRLLVNIPAPLYLSELITKTILLYEQLKISSSMYTTETGITCKNTNSVAKNIHAFILDRLQSSYHAEGISNDILQAVKACETDWLYDFDKRIRALAHFVNFPEATSLAAACKRVNNLLQHEKIDQFRDNKKISPKKHSANYIKKSLLQEGAEKILFTTLTNIEQVVSPLYEQKDYVAILTQLASLKEPIDAFFEHVMVMVDDDVIKLNRLALLSRLQILLQGVADISLLLEKQ